MTSFTQFYLVMALKPSLTWGVMDRNIAIVMRSTKLVNIRSFS